MLRRCERDHRPGDPRLRGRRDGLTLGRRAFLQGAAATAIAGCAGWPLDSRPVLDVASAERELAEHRIAGFGTWVLRDRHVRPVGRNAKRGPAGSGGPFRVCVVSTSRGARGWGMCWADEERLDAFVGIALLDLFDVGAGLRPEVPTFLDVPIHDLVGQILGAPVRELLGARGPTEVPVYSTAVGFEDLEERDPAGVPAVVEACRQDHAASYRAFKLKVGRGARWMPRVEGLARDVEVVRSVCEALPDCRVLVDANDGFSVDDACEFVRQVADCDLCIIEEPFPEARDDLLRLREAMERAGCQALIADGETRVDGSTGRWRYGAYSPRHMDALFGLADEGLVDVFVTDLDLVGYSNWRRTMPELEAAGVLASPHSWAWTPRTYYTTQLAAGVGNVCIAEGVPGRADGRLSVPDTPGFGLGFSEPV